MLTPVDNPTAYGLVETDAAGNIRRFLEKPNADEITCDTINAGIYVLEPDTFDRIPKDTPWSIERSFFPVADRARARRSSPTSTAATGSTSARPRNYMQVHRDIMDGTLPARAIRSRRGAWRRLDLAGGARRGRRHHRGRPASSTRAPSSRPAPHRSVQRRRPPVPHRRACGPRPRDRLGQHAASARRRSSGGSILGRHCHIGRSALVENGVVLGDKSVVTDYSRL